MNEITITKFLSAFFSEDESFMLRIICHDEERDRNDRYYPTTLNELQKSEDMHNYLKKENITKDICFYPHSVNVHDNEVRRYNAFVIELSKRASTAHYNMLDTAPIPPSIIIENKDSVCAFWLIEGDCSSSDWLNVQFRLTEYFKGGEENIDHLRPLRIPFFNQVLCNGKVCAPTEVKVVSFDSSRRFRVEQMIGAYLPPESYATSIIKNAAVESLTQCSDPHQTGCNAEKAKVEMIDVRKKISSNSSNSSVVLTETDSFPILDDKALYGLAGEIVNEIARDSESHPAALLTQFLVAYGNLVGFSPYFKTEADLQGVNLFTVIVGNSARSGRKGTSWANIRTLFSQVDKTWFTENFQNGGLSSGEGIITRLRDPNSYDPGIIDKRLLVTESEFASVLRVKGRESNTLDTIFRNAWDRMSLNKMVSSKANSMRVTDPHFSFIGHITKEELRLLIKDVDAYNGYANRILWVCTTRTKKLPRGGEFFKRDISKYINALKDNINYARDIGEMDFSSDANEFWTHFYLSIDDNEEGMIAAILARAEAQVVRLAMLYALLDGSNIIYKIHLESALALWQYCEDSVRFIFGRGLSSGANKLLESIREASNKGLSRSDIITNVFNKNKSKLEIDGWIAELKNLIEFDDSKKLYFSKVFNDTNNEFNEFDELDEPSVSVMEEYE